MLRALARTLKNRSKNTLHRIFLLGQRLGVDILPRHFYSDIPDIRTLKQSDYWRAPLSMCGINGADVDEQFAFVRQCCQSELRQQILDGDIYARACQENGTVGFGPGDAAFPD